MNILTTGEQDNIREIYHQVTLNPHYTPAEGADIVEVPLHSGNTARGVVDGNNDITVFEVIYAHLQN